MEDQRQHVKLVRKAPRPRTDNVCDLPVLTKSCPSALIKMLLGENKLKVKYDVKMQNLNEVLVGIHENDMLVNTCPSCRTDGVHNLPVLTIFHPVKDKQTGTISHADQRVATMCFKTNFQYATHTTNNRKCQGIFYF